MSQTENTYDAVIIGAGISGLVCGCYLAKAGMKVLVAEQHHKPGGYCTSFKRKGFTFDAAAHSFGGLRPGGNMNKVLTELGIRQKIAIRRYDPSDIVVSPDCAIRFWADPEETMRELQRTFPEESRNIRDFMTFFSNPRPEESAALRRKTFGDVLNRYFQDTRLKALLSLPLLGNGDLPPSLISAFSGSKIFSEFMLDGGYYPEGGMQTLSDALAERLREFGGELRVSSMVRRITLRDDTVTGVVLEKDGVVRSQYVISNCDARQTFLKLIGKKAMPTEFLSTLAAMVPSRSIFVLYLGIDGPFDTLPNPGSNVWFLPHYDIERLYQPPEERRGPGLAEYYMVRASPDGKSVLAFVNAPFRNKSYWVKNKNDLREALIKRIEESTISHLSRHIVYKDAATPYTMHRYTLNYKGAAYGWAGMLSQFAIPDFRRPSFVKQLYLTGHWTTYAQGIPGVAYMGYDTARAILKREKMGV